MKYIYTFNKERDQIEALSQMNDTDVILSGNLESNKILISKDASKNRIYKYVDENNNILDDYLDVDKNYLRNDNVAPKQAKRIAVIDTTTNEILKYDKINIPNNNDTPLYSVGLISDVHYNDIDESDNSPLTFTDDGSEYSDDLKNALQYFSNNAEFICCSGDISTDNLIHLLNYNKCIDEFGNNVPVYTCSGNHDTAPKYFYKHYWLNSTIRNNIFDINFFIDDEYTSYYFVKELPNNKRDIYIFLNVDYGNGEDGNYPTHHPRLLYNYELLCHSEVKNYDYHLYDPTTLLYLADILEDFKNDRCFIFTHLMFDEYAGTYHGDDYLNYSKMHVDIIKRHYDQGEFLYDLLERYSNNYWFSGHSHYKWAWDKLDNNINVSKTQNGSYTIHIPSLARPITYGTTYYSVNLKESEAGLMDVYEDYVVLNGIVMKEDNFDISKNIPNDEEYLYANNEMFSNQNENIKVEQLEDDYLLFTLKTTENLYFNPNDVISRSNCTNAIIYMKFEDIYCYETNSGNDITNEVLEEELIGFRDNTTDSSKYPYYMIDNHIYTIYENGALFKKSSVSKFKNIDISIKLKIKYKVKFQDYINKILPISIYKLD